MVTTATRSTRTKPEQLSRADRVARGKDARTLTPLGAQAEVSLGRKRDPVGLLLEQGRSRVAELVPIRHGRMLASPFAYFRGAALPMTADLANTPVAGLRVQLCGDAHAANFGAFASPERRLVFDINDFDETLPGPFEWDVKRLAASLAVSVRQNGFGAKARQRVIRAAAQGYRTAMREFAEQPLMQVWYAHLEVDSLVAGLRSQVGSSRLKQFQSVLADAHTRDSRQALAKLTTEVDGRRRIISNPPTVVPIEELYSDVGSSEAIYDLLRNVLTHYRRSLQSDRRHLLEQFSLVQVARKVVGVGSVGQRAWVVLLEGNGDEPLFLQAKEAQPSVLADHCGHSLYRHQGERVVAGQHLMQAQSDIFLGWTRSLGPDGAERDFYVRQLRDWKFSMPLDQMRADGMTAYARICGATLARAHARSGDRVALAAYLGRSDRFDSAICEFADAYADQNESDYAAFQAAVTSGRIEAVSGV